MEEENFDKEKVKEFYNYPLTDLKSSIKNAPITADILETLFKHETKITVEDALKVFDDCKTILLKLFTI